VPKDQNPEERPPGDQRRELRSPLLVQNVKVEPAGQKAFFGYAKNISRSGMFIGTTNPKEPGSQFNVEIPFPAPIATTITCACEVVWQRNFSRKSQYEPGMGLKFVDLPKELAERIDAWVKDKSSLMFSP